MGINADPEAFFGGGRCRHLLDNAPAVQTNHNPIVMSLSHCNLAQLGRYR
jgi:hypothetical protein